MNRSGHWVRSFQFHLILEWAGLFTISRDESNRFLTDTEMYAVIRVRQRLAISPQFARTANVGGLKGGGPAYGGGTVRPARLPLLVVDSAMNCKRALVWFAYPLAASDGSGLRVGRAMAMNWATTAENKPACDHERQYASTVMKGGYQRLTKTRRTS